MQHARTIAMATTLLADGRATDVADMVTPLLDSVTVPTASTGQILLRSLMARVEVTHRGHPERAFDLLPTVEDVSNSCTCVRAKVALWRGWALARAPATVDEAAQALHLLKEGQELLASICDPVGRGWALIGRAQAYEALGEYGLMRRVLDDASALLDRLQDTQAERWHHELRIRALRTADRSEQAAEHVSALRSIAEDWDDDRVRGVAAAYAALLRSDRGADPATLVEHAETATALLRKSDATASGALLRATRAHVDALVQRQEWTTADDVIDTTESLLADLGFAKTALQTLRARVALRRGEPERALEMLDRAVDRRLPSVPGLPRSSVALLYGDILTACTLPDEAETWVRWARHVARETGHRANEHRARQTLAEVSPPQPRASTTTLDPTTVVQGFIAESREMQTVAETIRRIQPSRSPVLITGEGGVGKRLVARAIHDTSVRADEPLETISCDPTQTGKSLEAQLLGPEGAAPSQSRALQAARRGTLVIEDIDALPSSLQSVLLDLLGTGRVPTVNDADADPVDVRIIATTTADLDARVQEGRFLPALRNRLRVISLHVPPLRERRPDISLLARHFLDQLRPADSALVSITQPAMEALLRYNWPGNVRQLRNEIERALVHVQSEPAPTIDLTVLHDTIVEGAKQSRSAQTPHDTPDAILEPDQTLSDVLSRTEKAVIKRVLKACNGQVTASADVLGLTRQGLYKKMKRLDIDASAFQSSSEPTPTT